MNVLDRCRAPRPVGHDVMELQESPLGAAMSRSAEEGALSRVASPDRAPDLCGDVAGAGCNSALLKRMFPRAVRGGQFLPGQPLEERGQGPIEDRRRIAIGDLVAQQ